jgi:hypothetical protein
MKRERPLKCSCSCHLILRNLVIPEWPRTPNKRSSTLWIRPATRRADQNQFSPFPLLCQAKTGRRAPNRFGGTGYRRTLPSDGPGSNRSRAQTAPRWHAVFRYLPNLMVITRAWGSQSWLPAATVIRTHLCGYFFGRGRLSDYGIRFVWKYGLLGPKARPMVGTVHSKESSGG